MAKNICKQQVRAFTVNIFLAACQCILCHFLLYSDMLVCKHESTLNP